MQGDCQTAVKASESDRMDFLEAGIRAANVPTLLMVVAQLTGEDRWLCPPYVARPLRSFGDPDDGGYSDAVKEEIRVAALSSVRAFLESRQEGTELPSRKRLIGILAAAVGETVPGEYGDLMRQMLEPPPRQVPRKSAQNLSAIVIGAGASGICAGVKLGELGIEYSVIERNDAIGGVWAENRYPGCGVDVPSAIYGFDFAPNDWLHYFAHRDEVQSYMERVARESGMAERTRLRTEVMSARFQSASGLWTISIRNADGSHEELHANFLISGVGAFNPPKAPRIKGLDTFGGPCFHTAQWPQDLDVTGLRVGIIGNGASAMQTAPAIAGQVKSLTLFQRTPQWIAPFSEELEGPIPEEVRALSRTFPLYAKWYRLRQAWLFNDRNYPLLQVDENWPNPELSLSKSNDRVRRFLTGFIEEQLAGRPDLLEKSTPRYPPFGKRMLLDHGWYRTLRLPHVKLVTSAIEEISNDGVLAADGEFHSLDALVLATGFDVARFLGTVEITGPYGRTLNEVWQGDNGFAYLGTTVPGFPNLFMLYGPNTQTGHGGSVIFALEAQMNYIQSLLRQIIKAGAATVECREEVCAEYNERVNLAHERMVWRHKGVQNYYKNASGRVVVNSPWRVVDFWKMTRQANIGDFLLQ